MYADGALQEEIGGLHFTGKSPRTLERTVNERSRFVRVEIPPMHGRVARRAGARAGPVPGGAAGRRDHRRHPGRPGGLGRRAHRLPRPRDRRERDDGGDPRSHHDRHERGRQRRRGALPLGAEAADRLVRGQPHPDGDPRHAARPQRHPCAGVAPAAGPGLGVRDAVLPERRHQQPVGPARCQQRRAVHHGAADRPRRRRVGPHRRHPRGLEGAGERGRARHSPGWSSR